LGREEERLPREGPEPPPASSSPDSVDAAGKKEKKQLKYVRHILEYSSNALFFKFGTIQSMEIECADISG
jgi:hypothetical protein